MTNTGTEKPRTEKPIRPRSIHVPRLIAASTPSGTASVTARTSVQTASASVGSRRGCGGHRDQCWRWGRGGRGGLPSRGRVLAFRAREAAGLPVLLAAIANTAGRYLPLFFSTFQKIVTGASSAPSTLLRIAT